MARKPTVYVAHAWSYPTDEHRVCVNCAFEQKRVASSCNTKSVFTRWSPDPKACKKGTKDAAAKI